MGERAASQEEMYKKVEEVITKWTKNGQSDDDDLKESLFRLASPESAAVTNRGTMTADASDEEELRTKRLKLSDDHIEAVEGATRRASESSTKTLQEIALYIVDHSRDDNKAIQDLEIILSVQNKKVLLSFGGHDSRKKFRESIDQYDEADFQSISFGEYRYKRGKFDAEEALGKINETMFPHCKLLGEINRVCSSTMEQDDDIPKWEETFVVAEDKSQLERVNFPKDMSKGFALVVTGESGSGKSWFAKYFVLNKLGKHDTAYINYTLSDEDVATLKPDISDPMFRHACKVGLRSLFCQGMSDTPVYESVSELSRSINRERNREAIQLFKTIISEALNDSKVASDWWEAENSPVTVQKLIVVIDEVGKAPGLARGLVDEVRTIYADITRRRLAEKVLLVLVGSGLEHHIREDTVDFEVETEEEKAFKSSMASFGTDPRKSDVIVLKGPVLEEDGKIHGVATKDITEGTYSRVLATNTRMLTRGVIPIFKSSILTGSVTELSTRRRALGSTNIVMDYAARVYIELNGLQRLDASALESVLLTQFRLLMYVKLKSQDRRHLNPVFQGIINDIRPTRKDFEKTLNRGLITVDITNTSNALRYLACGGRTAPLDAQDGIAFEVILQHHLVRLSQAHHNRRIQKDQVSNQRSEKEKEKALEDENYFCGQYDLRQAWPPSSSKGDDKLGTHDDVVAELKARCDGCKDDDDDHDHDDVAKIAELVGNKAEFDLVMRQTVSNVQGGDILVLSKADSEISLDMYQAKHYKTIPGPATKSIKNAFSSLGVEVVGEEMETEPAKGSAGFSYHGTMQLATKLAGKLGMGVKIRSRVLVFSKDWQALSSHSGWKTFDFKKAYKKRVMLWTREMMEPTISALEYVPSAPSKMT